MHNKGALLTLQTSTRLLSHLRSSLSEPHTQKQSLLLLPPLLDRLPDLPHQLAQLLPSQASPTLLAAMVFRLPLLPLASWL